MRVMSEPRGSHSFFAVRRRADRTVTLSQIVHLTLRCMLNANFDDCLRTDPPTRVRSAMTRTAPCFRQPQRDRAVFSPDADDRHEACLSVFR